MHAFSHLYLYICDARSFSVHLNDKKDNQPHIKIVTQYTSAWCIIIVESRKKKTNNRTLKNEERSSGSGSDTNNGMVCI